MEGEKRCVKRGGGPVREENSKSEAKYTEKWNPFRRGRGSGSDSALHCREIIE